MTAWKKVACPVCTGSGKRVLRVEDIDTGTGTLHDVPVIEMCPRCSGTGEIFRDIGDIEREEAWEAVKQENKADTETPTEPVLQPLRYWDNISEMNDRQEAKGLHKYSQPLEENTDMPNVQRIEHAQEEAIDLLKYLEHLKQTVADGITANDYQRAAMRTASGMDYKNQSLLMNGVLGLCGETGEVADIVKKATFQGHELDKDHIAEELGDVSWYLAVASYAIGYNLGDIFQMNIDKLAKRYPEGFSKERSLNREGK